jgi:heme iron utilization protein
LRHRSEDLRETIRTVFTAQRLAVLSTQAEGQPYGNLVAFSFSEDLSIVVFATLSDTSKYRRIAGEPRVALLVDNRTDGEADLQAGVAVTALGAAQPAAPHERETLVRLHLSRHPSLREFLSAPGCALVRVEVSTYLVSGFQEVEVVRVR